MERGEDKLSRTGATTPASPGRRPQGRGPGLPAAAVTLGRPARLECTVASGTAQDVASGYFLQERTQALQMPLCLLWEADKEIHEVEEKLRS